MVILKVASRSNPNSVSGAIAGALVFLQIIVVFHLFCAGILCFAVESVPDVFEALKAIIFNFAGAYRLNMALLMPLIVVLCPLFLIEFFQYKTDDETVVLKWPLLVRGLVYYFLFYFIVLYGDFSAQRYYYFQF